MRNVALPYQRCCIDQVRSDGNGLVRIDHWDDLYARVDSGYRFEEEDRAGKAAEEFSCASEESVSEREVAE